MAGAHHLLGLTLAAIGNAPERPVLAPGDGVAGIPELGGDSAVAGVLQHAHALAAADLPGDLAAELEVVPLVVDRPAAIGLHVDPVLDIEDLVERLLAGLQAHIGHADQRQPGPAIGAHAAVGARLAHRRRGLARSHVAHELAVADDVVALRRHALIVEREGAEAGTVLQARIAHHVDDVRPIAQMAQLIEREEAHARVVGLAAQHAIELDGVADGFVNLQAQLRAVEDQVEFALGALVGLMQRHGLFGDARGVLQQAQLVHQFVAFQLELAAEGIGEGALLKIAVLVAGGRETRAREAARLIDYAAESRDEDLAALLELHGSFGQVDARVAAQFGVDGEQGGEAAVHRHRERVDLHGRVPHRLVLFFRRQRDFVGARRGAGPRDLQRQCGGALDTVRGEIVRGGEAPAAIGQHADSKALRFAAGNVPHLAVLDGEIAVARIHCAHVGIGDAAPRHRIQSAQGEIFHNEAETKAASLTALLCVFLCVLCVSALNRDSPIPEPLDFIAA